MGRWLAVLCGLTAVAATGVVIQVLTPDAALKDWGQGFIDAPGQRPTHFGLLDEALDLRLDDLNLVRPDALGALAAPLVKRWRVQRDVDVHVGPTLDDGARPFHVRFDCAVKGVDRCSLAAAGEPVACPEASDTQRCYHAAFEFGATRYHAAITLEMDAKTGAVQADASVLALLYDGGALGVLRTVGLGNPLAKFDGLHVTEGLQAVDAAADLDVDEDGLGDGWRFEFSARAEGQLRRELAPTPIGKRRFLSARAGGARCPAAEVIDALDFSATALAPCADMMRAGAQAYRWRGVLDAERGGVAARDGNAATMCVDEVVSSLGLPTAGAPCDLELEIAFADLPARPWRWIAGRARAPKGHR